jgi:ribosomal-protein-serine acetyltransferase
VKLIADERTLLRAPVEDDAESLFALTDRNRVHLREWLPWLDFVTCADDSRAFLRSAIERIAAGTALELLIERDGELCGIAGFRAIDAPNRAAEIGYWLGAELGGRGVMTAAVRALVRHGFEELGLNRIGISAALGNTKSRRVAERLGFRQDGVLRDGEWLYDHFVDLAVYTRLRRDPAP